MPVLREARSKTARCRRTSAITAREKLGEKASWRGLPWAVGNSFSKPAWALRLFILTSVANGLTYGMQCYSCHGECFSERHCNCHTGMCEGDYCFTEKWAREGGYVIYKGCGKGHPRIGSMGTCDYQRLKERIFCLCNDEDFCNEGSASSALSFDNATCLHCAGGGCGSRCNLGDYCLADFTRNQYTCAHGQPVLPFHYQGRELQQTYVKPWPVCAAFRAGPVYGIAECICTNPACNNPSYLRDHLHFDDIQAPLLHCHSCAEEMANEMVLPSCRRQKCLGEYCAIKFESVFDPLASASGGGSSKAVGSGSAAAGASSGSIWTKSFRFKQWSGCLNTTRPDKVLQGTFQRWTVGTRQVTECVCRKDFCNLDIKLCMKAGALGSQSHSVQLRHWISFIAFALYCFRAASESALPV